ncbi:MAG: DUF3887 domain-containing protein, partial [Bacteroidaceae bacterium]|nr:DUF3887 domain-containing protein [Bacteroidaceae bacterium]
MKRLCGILAALLAANSFLCAQDFAPSEQVLSFIRAGQGDSVYARCNATMRNALTPQQLSTLWAGLERQFGTLQKAEAWEAEDAAAGYVIHMRQLQFRNQPIKAILSWNDNLLAGLYFRAVEATAPPTALQSDAEGIDFEVQTGKILLPGTLLLPKKTAEKPPCIILVHGSGPADRDETVGPTPFFRQLADSLAAAG